MEAPVTEARKVSLFRNGRNQAVRIPVEYELPGDEALIHKEGDKLIIEPSKPDRNWLALLRAAQPLGPEDDFPDIDSESLPPQRDVEL
jgi:antitoxin VapB